MAYDAADRRTGVIDALGQSTSFAYDAAGNQTSVTDALGHTTAYTYDALNRRTRTTFADGTTTGTTYDALGRRLVETDQGGLTKTFGYDALGRLTGVTDALGQVTAYTYDELGEQLTQTDALGRTTAYAYDRAGRRIGRTLPLGQSEALTYDLAGNLTRRTDFNGTVSAYAYDSLDRLLSRSVVSAGPGVTPASVAFTYTATGQRASMSDASGVTGYTYDARDRLLTKASPEGTLRYTYDAGGNFASLASDHPGGISLGYAHDALNRLSQVSDSQLGAATYAYDGAGNLQSFYTPNGVAHAYAYSAVNRLTQLVVWQMPGQGPMTPLATYAYTLAPTGHRLGVSESGPALLPTNPSATRTVAYTYDSLYRLTSETLGGAAAPAGRVGYTLDGVGNRLTRTAALAGLTGQTFSYDNNDRLTSDSYDAAGNTILGHPVLNAAGAEQPSSAVSDTYDSENHLLTRTGAAAVSIVYDGDGNKVRETVNGITTSYLIDDRNPTGYAQVVEELRAGALARTYTFGHDLLAQDQPDSTGPGTPPGTGTTATAASAS